jgi:hypothetical protein
MKVPTHKEILRRYRLHGAQQKFRTSAVLSIVIFIASLIINELAIHFATERASNPVTDIILSNTKALPVDNLFIYGTIGGVVVLLGLCFSHPKRIPFMMHTAALFFIIRSIFVSLTHAAPFAPHLADDFGATLNRAFFGADLFFSGHTGLPFLAALAFWHEPKWRYIFLGSSIAFAIIVLLGHIHYSIDVLSAFFITYGIYHIALWLFPYDHALFMSKDGEYEQ